MGEWYGNLRKWTLRDIRNGQVPPERYHGCREHYFQTAYKHMCDAQEARKELQKALDRQDIVEKISGSTLHQLKVSKIATLCSRARIHVNSVDKQ